MKILINGLEELRRRFTDFDVSDIADARAKLIQERSTPDRISMSKYNAKRIMRLLGMEPGEKWNPPDGSQVGLIYGVPVFIDEAEEMFTMVAKHD